MRCRAILASAIVAGLACALMTGKADAQMRSFERDDRGGMHVVLTGPGLLRSFGTWAFFPYALAAPGDFVSGSIRTFSSLPTFLKNNLTLLSVSDPSRMSSVFPEPRDAESKRSTAAETTILTPLPVSMSRLLTGSQEHKFRLERLSQSEFLFSLADQSVRILVPGGNNFWGLTVSFGSDVWVPWD